MSRKQNNPPSNNAFKNFIFRVIFLSIVFFIGLITGWKLLSTEDVEDDDKMQTSFPPFYSTSCPISTQISSTPCPSCISNTPIPSTPCPSCIIDTPTPCPSLPIQTQCPIITSTPCPTFTCNSTYNAMCCPPPPLAQTPCPTCISSVPSPIGTFTTNIFTDASTGINYTSYIFSSSQSIRFSCDVGFSTYLIVAGGGGGGTNGGGGGGGGGILTGNTYFLKNVDYSLTIGSGGLGVTQSTTTCWDENINKGKNSILNSGKGVFTAIGGGAGACRDAGTGGMTGGSGGGGASNGGGGTTRNNKGFGISSNISYFGGNGYNDGAESTGGGGGGGGGAGESGTYRVGGNGGFGYTFMNGLTYGGGGGGGVTIAQPASGTIPASKAGVGRDGGGNGATSGNGLNGTSNTGGGGGGGGPAGNGGNGGSGVIIISIPNISR